MIEMAIMRFPVCLSSVPGGSVNEPGLEFLELQWRYLESSTYTRGGTYSALKQVTYMG